MDHGFIVALAFQIGDSLRLRRQQHVADRVRQHSIDLFGHRSIETPQPRFHVADRDLLIDAPPEKLEVQFQVDVKSGETDLPPQPLAEISPVVKALATEQFDSYVKQVRVFVHPDVYGQLGKESMPAVSKLCERILRDICCG